jgi:hypothetical protein
MRKEARVGLRSFPLKTAQDPYTFRIKMAALKKNFTAFVIEKKSYKSPEPVKKGRTSRNSLGDRWFPSMESLLQAPKKKRNVTSSKEGRPRVRLSFSSTRLERVPTLRIIRKNGVYKVSPRDSLDLGYKSESPDYSPRFPTPIEDQHFREEVRRESDNFLNSLDTLPKMEELDIKTEVHEYVEEEEDRIYPELVIDEEDPLEEGELGPTPPASPISEFEYALGFY